MYKTIRIFLSFLLVMQLIIPFSTFAAAVGEFSAVVGNVTQTREKKVIKPIEKSPIALKDFIATAHTSSAAMVFSDESTITLSENTKLEIKEFIFKDQSRRGIFSLPIGKLTANVQKYIGGNNVFEIISPTVGVGVRGTGFEFVEAVKEAKGGPATGSQRWATITCTDGSLNLSALSPVGEIVKTAVLEAGQVAVIIGGVITISTIGVTAASAVAKTVETGTAGTAGGTGGAAAVGAAGGAVATTGLSTAALTGIAIGGAAVVGGAAAAAGSSGGGGDASTSCSHADGKWSGTISGTNCHGSGTGDTWVMNCSRCSCPDLVFGQAQHVGNCTVSGNNVSCSIPAIVCGTQNTPCTVTLTGTISGNSLSGTFNSDCNGIYGNWIGNKQ